MGKTINIRGVNLELHYEGEALSDSIRASKDFYEAHILDWITHNIGDKHSIILDVGANIGNHTMYMARFWRYEYIYAFEALSANYEVLKRNIKNSLYAPFISAINVALTDEFKDCRIEACRDNMGASHIVGGLGEAVHGVPLDFFDFSNVSFIKIDIEDHEPWFLKGAQKTIIKNKPIIMIEDGNDPPEYAEKYLPEEYKLVRGWDRPEYTYIYKWER